jgi:hypothetical protein
LGRIQIQDINACLSTEGAKCYITYTYIAEKLVELARKKNPPLFLLDHLDDAQKLVELARKKSASLFAGSP